MPKVDFTGAEGMENSGVASACQSSWLPPLQVFLYAGSILVAGAAGSDTGTLAGANVEHVFLGAASGLIFMSVLFEDNYRRMEGLSRVLRYLSLLGLAVFLGLLSSIRAGPEIVGAKTLIYWCGLVVSTGVGAMLALQGHSRWVLAAVMLAGIPLIASVLHPFIPSLESVLPAARLRGSYMGRATGFFANPNSTGFALYCCFAGCLCSYHGARRWWGKSLCVGLCILYIVSICLTLSRASIAVTVLTSLAFLYTLWRGNSYRWLLAAALFPVILWAGHYALSEHIYSTVTESRVFDADLYEGDTFRFQGLCGAVRNLGSLLFLGEGSGQFVEVSGAYIDRWAKAPHNQIVGIWVEWGFLAVALMYAAHVWVIHDGFLAGRWRTDDGEFMLLAVYCSILLFLQLHEVNSPASCTLLGLCAGRVARSVPIGLPCRADLCSL